jgi:pimeloyl-ACP methyl ester carboxylesterase
MPVLSLTPALTLLAAFSRFSPAQPVHTLFRAAGYRLRPPRPRPFVPVVTAAQSALLASGAAEPRQRAIVLREERLGATPTIVLGGFVPDSTEQVFLLRGYLLRRGSVYYFNYPRGGFSPALICAQLDDLVAELHTLHGQRPVILGVSFGAGLALDWLRRARAAAVNIVPTSTGAATAVALVYPPMKGKLNGIALRVPTPNVSVVDMVLEVQRETSKEEVNAALKAASEGAMKGIIKYSDLPLVSSDFAGTDESTIVDSALTIVMGGNMVKVISWYDNEWGYSQRVVDLAEVVAKNWA